MRWLSRIIVTTSVSETVPSTTRLETAIASLRSFEAPIVVVADALPSALEVQGLAEVDASKWRSVWRKEKEYEEYLRRVAEIPGIELEVAARFGHLVGSVRLGLRGLADDEIALITQHDLQVISPQVVGILGDGAVFEEHPYVLLNRDDPRSPRSVAWFGELAKKTERPGLLDLGGGFSDQTHFVRVGWYRQHVLRKCGDLTCMEHAVRRCPTGTTACVATRAVNDLGRGSMVSAAEARGMLGIEASDWSVVHFCETGEPRGLCEHGEGVSRRATRVALAPPLEEVWSRQDGTSAVLCVARRSSSSEIVVAGSADGGISVLRGDDGTTLERFVHSSPIWSARGSLVGDASRVRDLVSGASSPDLGGRVRALASLGDDDTLAVGCATVSRLKTDRLGFVEAVLDAGPTGAEEPWRRHDILCLATTTTTIYAGLVDGSLRYWSDVGGGVARSFPRRHRGRVVAIEIAGDAVITASRDGTVKRWQRNADLTPMLAFFDAKGPISCATANADLVALGTQSRVLLLDAQTLHLRCAAETSARVASILLLDDDDVVVLGLANGHILALRRRRGTHTAEG